MADDHLLMTALNEFESKAVARAHGLTVVPGQLVGVDELGRLDDLLADDGPFAVKFVSRAIAHKTELGAVAVNVARADVEATCRGMLESDLLRSIDCDGFLVEQMAARGEEVVIGGYVDGSFGPVVMLGLGGIWLEVLEDVTFRLCPVSRGEVHAMLDELLAARILHGYRRTTALDLEGLVDAVLAIGGEQGLMLRARPAVAEIDINPLIVSEHAAVCADVHVRLADSEGVGAHGG